MQRARRITPRLEEGGGLKAENKTTRRMRKENPMLKGGKTSQNKEKLKKDGEKIQTPSLKNKLKSSPKQKGNLTQPTPQI
jgi:hypothetical protein